MIDQLRDGLKGLVLDLGFGHGFLSYEIAVRTRARIVGLDLLGGDQLQSAKNSAKIGGLEDRISWIVGDARKLPFQDRRFDVLVSFLALQDAVMIGGPRALARILRSSVSLVKSGGIMALADNMFPECALSKSQKLYWKMQNREFQGGLPRKDHVVGILRRLGVHDLEERFYDPKIDLSANESEIELKDVVDSKPFGRKFNFSSLWRRYQTQINALGLSYPRVLLIIGRA